MLMMLALWLAKMRAMIGSNCYGLLWVQRPGDREGALKGNPADADDARPLAR